MTYAVYTNSLFSGTTSISVDVDKVSYDKNGFAGTLKGVYVQLWKSVLGTDQKVGSAVEVSLSGGVATFTGLSSSTKYYVEFYKQNDGSIYKFGATITD